MWTKTWGEQLEPTERKYGGHKYKKLQKNKFQKFYFLPNVITVIKSRAVKWMIHAACITEMWTAYSMLIGKIYWKRIYIGVTDEDKNVTDVKNKVWSK